MDTLNQYGYGFQVKILSCLITDRNFLSQTYDLLNPKYFDNDALKFLITSTLDYFKEYRLTPTLEVFKVQLSNFDTQSLRYQELRNALKDAWKHTESHDLKFIKEETIKFCRHQEIKKAYEDGIELFKNKKYDELVSLITTAANKGNFDDSRGLDYLLDVDYRYDEQSEKPRVKTGWDVIDEVTNGGLPKGKLGVLIAPTGIGKSWCMAFLAAAGLKQGKTVLLYTLELDDTYIAQRIDSILSGIPFNDLKYNIPRLKKFLSKYQGKLIVKEYPQGTLTIHGLEASIDKFILNNVKPDLVVVDWVECLAIDFSGNLREDKVLGELYKNLRGLAGRKEFSMWTADQTNRCLKLDSMIDVEGKGNIQIGDVELNDKILTHDGFKTISKIYPITKQAVYRIKLKNGSYIDCSIRHEFPTSHGKMKSILTGLKPGDKLFVKT